VQYPGYQSTFIRSSSAERNAGGTNNKMSFGLSIVEVT
jgi:hypothetical protein